MFAYLVFGESGALLEQLERRHQEARRAEPALQSVVLAEGFLQWMKPVLGLFEAFDCPDLGAL
jgi:hypothetical protein